MDKPEKCYKCLKTPDDILMLSCNHDMCLPCAGDILSLNRSKENEKLFSCPCGAVTELDLSAIYEIEKLVI